MKVQLLFVAFKDGGLWNTGHISISESAPVDKHYEERSLQKTQEKDHKTRGLNSLIFV